MGGYWDRVIRHRASRRRALGALAGGTAAAAFLAACGSDDEPGSAAGGNVTNNSGTNSSGGAGGSLSSSAATDPSTPIMGGTLTAPIVGSSSLGAAILTEAALSFLGLGVQPPTPSWGNMINASSRLFLFKAPWVAIFPGLAITAVVTAFNFIGDAIRDEMDPRLRSR